MELQVSTLVSRFNIFLVLVLSASVTHVSGKGNVKVITKQLNPNLFTAIEELALSTKPFSNLLPPHLTQATKTLSKDKSKLNQKLRENQVELYACHWNDSVIRSACFEFCTKLKYYEQGDCSEDETTCRCSSKGEASIQIKLYTPHPRVPVRRPKASPYFPKIPKLERTAIGKFDCDHSPSAKSICRVFCQTQNSSHSACSVDKTACLCFSFHYIKSTESSREKRNLELGLVEESVVMEPRIRGPRPRPRPNLVVARPMSPVQHLLGCNRYSCVNNCPPGCDSLCSANLQCFCSCPQDDYEDVYYDMYGGGPGPAYYYGR